MAETTKATHIRGPWIIEAGTRADQLPVIMSARGQDIAFVRDGYKADGTRFSDEEIAATALLIKTAPKLLAALEAIYGSLRITRGVPSIDVALLNQAKAAIEEARGS